MARYMHIKRAGPVIAQRGTRLKTRVFYTPYFNPAMLYTFESGFFQLHIQVACGDLFRCMWYQGVYYFLERFHGVRSTRVTILLLVKNIYQV